MREGEKLRKVSDRVLQEAQPPADRSKPLEWRRSVNVVNLRLKDLQLVTSCSIHETVFGTEDGDERLGFSKDLKPNIEDGLGIKALVDEGAMRDRIYCAVEDKEDNSLLSLARAPSPLRVTLRTGKPTEATDRHSAGLYWGNAFPLDFDPRDDGYLFELPIPRLQMERLFNAVKTDHNAVIEVSVRMLSFTFEVDDFFREPWDRQDIVASRTAPCFVGWVNVTSKIGLHTVASDPAAEDEEQPQQREVPPEQRAHAELMQMLAGYLTPLKSVVTALWVLIGVGILHLLLK